MGRFSDRWANAGVVALIMTAPWVPLAGVVSFHLIALLTDQPGFSAFPRRLLGPYYVVSLAFAALGVFLYSGIAEARAIVPNQIYIVFSASSCLFAWGWGVVCLACTAKRSSSKRIRRTATLVLVSLVILTGFVAPILASVFFNISTTRFIYSSPYLALAFVALLAYAILRYQLFSAKSSVLIALLLVIFCIVIAEIIYLVIGQNTGFLPILAATLITAAALEDAPRPDHILHPAIAARDVGLRGRGALRPAGGGGAAYRGAHPGNMGLPGTRPRCCSALMCGCWTKISRCWIISETGNRPVSITTPAGFTSAIDRTS